MIRVALLKGTQNNQDYDVGRIIGCFADNSAVATGLAVTANTVGPGYGFLKVTRTGGQSFYILVENDDNHAINTSGTKKVRLGIDQSKIDDGSTIDASHSNVASIQTGSSWPGTPHLRLASISGGSITDEREVFSLKGVVREKDNQTINGVKTFSTLPRKSGSKTPTRSDELVTKYYVDTKPVNVPDANESTKGIQENANNTEGLTSSIHNKTMTPKRVYEALQARIPTSSEASEGTNDTKFMTPKKTKEVLDARKASDAQAIAKSDTSKYITPKHLGLVMADEGINKRRVESNGIAHRIHDNAAVMINDDQTRHEVFISRLPGRMKIYIGLYNANNADHNYPGITLYVNGVQVASRAQGAINPSAYDGTYLSTGNIAAGSEIKVSISSSKDSLQLKDLRVRATKADIGSEFISI